MKYMLYSYTLNGQTGEHLNENVETVTVKTLKELSDTMSSKGYKSLYGTFITDSPVFTKPNGVDTDFVAASLLGD